jgi:hypothetical protein
MRRPLISDASPWPLKAAAFVVLLPVLSAFMLLKIVMMPFDRPISRSADDVSRYLKDFLKGVGGPWDWDDFIHIPIADPRLENIRERATALDLPLTDADTALLKALIAEAEGLAEEARSSA